MMDPRVKDLNDQSTTWLIVAIAGFWLGFGWVTGPLAWVKASRIRNQYRQMGMAPSGNATGAYIVGIISTVLFAFVLLAVFGLIGMAMFVAAAA